MKWGVHRTQAQVDASSQAKANKSQEKAEKKAEKKWSKGFKSTAKKAMDEVYSDEKVQKELMKEVQKLYDSGLRGSMLENAYQYTTCEVMNKHLAKSPTAQSPSGKSFVQLGIVEYPATNQVFIKPYEAKKE